MERLTERERNIDGTGVAKEEITDGLLKPFAEKILTKLADYEDLEEQGLLVRLPCKVRDDLYCIVNGEVKKLKVHSFGVPDFGIIDIEFKYVDGFKIVRFVREVGQTVFLTPKKLRRSWRR